MRLDEIFENQKSAGNSSKKKTAKSTHGMAASAVREATDVGTKILEQDGNAVDAVIAMQFALAVVEGMNTGIAAGGFISIYDAKSGETKIVNGHSIAPEAVRPTLFIDEDGEVEDYDTRTMDPKSVGVPGILRALEVSHEKYGSLPMRDLIEPAIELAENGFRVNSLWERTLELFQDRLGEEAKKKFMPGGKLLVEGDHLKQPELAKTLRILRDEGIAAAYEGEIADAIVKTIEEHGGLITKEDLKKYEAQVDDPLWGTYKGFDLALTNPPNGGGFAVGQMLKIAEQLDITKYSPDSWEKYHLLAETMRLTLKDMHEHIEDPRFDKIPLHGLLDDEYIKERSSLISLDKRIDKVEEGNPWLYQDEQEPIQQTMETTESGMETTHFTAVDRWGNVAACTSSIERIYGSGILVPGYGFLLNNDLTDFNPEPDAKNNPNSWKFAVSAKSPTIMFHEGKPFFTLGSPGAKTIVASVLQVIMNVVDYKMDLKDAISEPRIYVTPDDEKEWEDGLPEEVLKKFEELGYSIDQGFREQTADDRIGDVQAILINSETGELYGAADSPRPGKAEGPTE